MRLFREVTGVDQSLMQQIVATVEETYLMDVHNCTMNSINDTVPDVLAHLQENYGQLIPRELLERDDIVKKTTYHPQCPIGTVFSAIKELLKFANITGTSYTQHQAVKLAYVIIHRTGKFSLAIRKWNRMPTMHKTWVRLKNNSRQRTTEYER